MMWHPTWFMDHGLDTSQWRDSKCQLNFWDSHTTGVSGGDNLEVPPLTNETNGKCFLQNIMCWECNEKQKNTPHKLIFKKSSMAGSGIQQTSWINWDMRRHWLLLFDLERMSGGRSNHFQKNTSSKQFDLSSKIFFGLEQPKSPWKPGLYTRFSRSKIYNPISLFHQMPPSRGKKAQKDYEPPSLNRFQASIFVGKTWYGGQVGPWRIPSFFCCATFDTNLACVRPTTCWGAKGNRLPPRLPGHFAPPIEACKFQHLKMLSFKSPRKTHLSYLLAKMVCSWVTIINWLNYNDFNLK